MAAARLASRCISPLKAQLGRPFGALEARLEGAVDARYWLPGWMREDYERDRRAARVSAAFHNALALIDAPMSQADG